MRRLIPIVGLLALTATACSQGVQAQVPEGPTGSDTGISVSGQGEVSGAPDVLTLDLGVSVLRDTVSAAAGDAADLAEALIASLTGRGVAREDIRTSNYSIYPEYDYREDRQTIRGYRVTNTVSVRIRDLGNAGEVIDAAVAAGGDDVVVNSLGFDLEDNQGLVRQAREAAWEDARAKAEQLADLAGVQLGSPLSIAETFAPTPPIIYEEYAYAAEADAATPIEPGQLSVTVTVEVRFAITR